MRGKLFLKFEGKHLAKHRTNTIENAADDGCDQFSIPNSFLIGLDDYGPEVQLSIERLLRRTLQRFVFLLSIV